MAQLTFILITIPKPNSFLNTPSLKQSEIPKAYAEAVNADNECSMCQRVKRSCYQGERWGKKELLFLLTKKYTVSWQKDWYLKLFLRCILMGILVTIIHNNYIFFFPNSGYNIKGKLKKKDMKKWNYAKYETNE
jgi:hypothetical protein